jgi:hypothetical protein
VTAAKREIQTNGPQSWYWWRAFFYIEKRSSKVTQADFLSWPGLKLLKNIKALERNRCHCVSSILLKIILAYWQKDKVT